jgi:replicative DNA helicase
LNAFDKIVSQRKAVEESWERLSINRVREWDLYGYDTGVHPLNMAIGGIIPTKVTVIGGRSGSGKTALTTPMFDATLRRKVDGSRIEYLFFTWELDPSIVIDRAICSRANVTLRQLNQGAKLLGEKTMAQIKSAYSLASKFPISYHIYSTNIAEVIAVSREFVERCKAKGELEGAHVQPVICIDYLNMAQFEEEGLRTYGIADFMNRLKGFCNETKAAAVVFTQLKREVDKSNKLPDRSDFSDSAAIENAADNLVVIYRPEYHNIDLVIDPDTGIEVDSRGKMLVRILKCRDYGTGDVLINCDIKHFRFWDKFQRHDQEYWKDYGTKEFWMREFNLTQLQQQESEINLFQHV